ncbi:hypothetical protein ES708_24378 [subsurface metagenome]
MTRSIARFVIPLFILFSAGQTPLFSDYPEIIELSRKDILFKQLQDDLKLYFQSQSRLTPGQEPAFKIFQYRNEKEQNIFSLAARLNIPYDTIATLNGLDHSGNIKTGVLIFVPNIPGIFVPLSPDSSFSEILHTIRRPRFEFGQEVLLRRTDSSKAMLFFPGERFHPLERAYFLEILFRLPLVSGKLSSSFGRRADPFTGHPEFHNGIDLAAPAGSEVLAARDGMVEQVGYHEVLGNYVILAHQGGFQTVYGHLDTIGVVLQQKVTSGMIIGSVGSTGRSTGPHLHFEIRRKGNVQDPVPLLPLGRKKN